MYEHILRKAEMDARHAAKNTGITTGHKRIGSPKNIVAPGVFCSSYQTVYNSFFTPPSLSIANAQNTMWCALVDAGIVAKLDLFYLFAQETNSNKEALVNWVNPGTYDATAYDHPAFTSLEGLAGDLSSAYIDTNWKPKTDGVNYTLNDASFGVYQRNDIIGEGLIYQCGTYDDTNPVLRSKASIRTKYAGTNCKAQVNSYTDVNVINTDSRGCYIATRGTANNQKYYKNGSVISSADVASTSVPDFEMYLLCRNNNSVAQSFSESQLSMFFAGSNLAQSEITILTNAIETYMDSNGKGVIT